MDKKLAVFDGEPVIKESLPAYCSVGEVEIEAVTNVIKSGCLSGFYGSWGDEFLGGPVIRDFEQTWSEQFKVKHTVSVNSATSGLYAAMGAVGLNPGDEVIVPPYTMSATVMAPLIYGGIPVFVDIEPDTFCLDVEAVRRAITSKTKAILVVNLFGHPAQLAKLRNLAEIHNLKLVEDNAQGPLASENGRYAGTIGHIGIFSLNYHKHIHTGEGGMCVTDDDELAQRLQLIRNHAENIVEPLQLSDISNMIGFNYRLTELSAAVGLVQLKNIENHVGQRERVGKQLSAGISDLEGLAPPTIRENCRHVFYVWAVRYDKQIIGVSREQFSRALAAEGFPNFTGYVRPLYHLPVFKKRIAFGSAGYPFNLTNREYKDGLCPVAERMYEEEFIGFEPCAYQLDSAQIELLIEAIRKVHAQRHELMRLT